MATGAVLTSGFCRTGISTSSEWLRLVLGLVAVFVLFQSSANILRSDRGQAGLVVGALVVAATIAVERVFFGQRVVAAARALGLDLNISGGDQLSFRQLDNTVWCNVARREVSYFVGKPPAFCSFASSLERSCAGAFASLLRSFCRFFFR